MPIEAEDPWVLNKLASDPPEEVLKFVIWVLWDTKPEDIPTDAAARDWKRVLAERLDASAGAIQKAIFEFDEFISKPA